MHEAYRKLLPERAGKPRASANSTWAVCPILLLVKVAAGMTRVNQLATSCAYDPDRRRRLGSSFVSNTNHCCRLSLNFYNPHVIVECFLMLVRNAIGHRPVNIHDDAVAVPATRAGCQRARGSGQRGVTLHTEQGRRCTLAMRTTTPTGRRCAQTAALWNSLGNV